MNGVGATTVEPPAETGLRGRVLRRRAKTRTVATIKRRPLMLPDVVRLHWATDWVARDKPSR